LGGLGQTFLGNINCGEFVCDVRGVLGVVLGGQKVDGKKEK
jgi:hypothetical protein